MKKIIALFVVVVFLGGFSSTSLAREVTALSTPSVEWSVEELWQFVSLCDAPCTLRKRAVKIIWDDKLKACASECENTRSPEHTKELRDSVISRLIVTVSDTNRKCFNFGDSWFKKNSIDELLK